MASSFCRRRRSARIRRPIPPSPETEPPPFPTPDRLDQVRPLRIEPVRSTKEGKLWNAFIDRYHYLGSTPMPGAQIRYFVRSAEGEALAALGFGAAAWKIAPRDKLIGWDVECRRRNLPFVVNNARFLCAVERRFLLVGANPTQQLSFRLVAARAVYGGNDVG